jgi:hypothetical protein
MGSNAVAGHQTSSDPTAWLWSQIGFGNLDGGKPVSVSSALPGDQKLYQLAPPSSTSLVNSVPAEVEFSQAFSMSDILEPGEVRVAPAEANIISGVNDGRGMSELMLLREALSAKGKEAARLTRELERAYGLIQRLQQQNIMYQQLEWNFQQQHQQQQQEQQQQIHQPGDANVSAVVNGARS